MRYAICIVANCNRHGNRGFQKGIGQTRTDVGDARVKIDKSICCPDIRTLIATRRKFPEIPWLQLLKKRAHSLRPQFFTRGERYSNYPMRIYE